MRNLARSLIRFKILKAKGEVEALLQNYSQTQRQRLEQILDEIVALSTQETDAPTLKKLLLDKAASANIEVSPQDLESIYIILAQKVSKKLAVAAAGHIKEAVKFSFDTVDAEAIEAMRKGFYWMGKEYNERLQNRLKDIIERIFKAEIANEEVGSALKEEFGSIINADESYFKGVADHIALQAQNVATITQGQKYGVEYYKILAIMDAKTSQICRSMHGRIIPAEHLNAQADKILNAHSLADKKAAAAWRDQAFLGKSLPKNFGLPPYHFRCRTEAVPVWIDEEEEGGVMMRNTQPLWEDELIRHIDKTGVERILDTKAANGGHGLKERLKQNDKLKSDIIKALNSITAIAPQKGEEKLSNAISSNGYFMVFDGDRIVTAFKPAKGALAYFKEKSVTSKQEIIKRWWHK
nr:hypothetical protein [uncultured Campylobacter sp.]